MDETTYKGYVCSCREKFELEGDEKTCVDLNECNYPNLNNCLEKEECKNVPGSFECSCKQGYLKVNNKCEDVDECHQEYHKCDRNAKCSNTEGSYTCTCNEDYSGNGFSCSEKIPDPPTHELCKKETSCGINTICTNVHNGTMCICKDYHYGNPEHGCVFKSPAEILKFEASLSIPLTFRLAMNYNYSLIYQSLISDLKSLLESMVLKKFIGNAWFSYEVKKIRFD